MRYIFSSFCRCGVSAQPRESKIMLGPSRSTSQSLRCRNSGLNFLSSPTSSGRCRNRQCSSLSVHCDFSKRSAGTWYFRMRRSSRMNEKNTQHPLFRLALLLALHFSSVLCYPPESKALTGNNADCLPSRTKVLLINVGGPANNPAVLFTEGAWLRAAGCCELFLRYPSWIDPSCSVRGLLAGWGGRGQRAPRPIRLSTARSGEVPARHYAP